MSGLIYLSLGSAFQRTMGGNKSSTIVKCSRYYTHIPTHLLSCPLVRRVFQHTFAVTTANHLYNDNNHYFVALVGVRPTNTPNTSNNNEHL